MSDRRLSAVSAWYARLDAQIETGTYRIVPFPSENVLDCDPYANLGAWLARVLWLLLRDESAADAAWESITGIPLPQ